MTRQLPIRTYNHFLLLVAGLGGLLYGIDIGVIDPALSYLYQSVQLSEQQLSYVVAAVLAGSILGSVVAGLLADWLGRRAMMIVSGMMFVGSVAIIIASQSFQTLMLGRLLQGMSGGVIAVVVPLYLAECLPAAIRGRGTAVFQFMLTIGIVLAAFVGDHYVSQAEQAIQLAGTDKAQVISAADQAWRGMFLSVIYPGLLFLLGTLLVPESPRWLYRRGLVDSATAVLRRMRTEAECAADLGEIGASLARENAAPRLGFLGALGEILTQRRYVLPFVLACVILGCNQATGINSLLQFMSTILQQAGMDPLSASSYGTAIKILNSAMTIVAILLVERKGRVFLLKLGTGGIIVSLSLLAALFYNVEARRVDVLPQVTALVQDNRLQLDMTTARFAATGSDEPLQISILYSYGERQQVAEAFMPTAEARRVLDEAASFLAGLPADDRQRIVEAGHLGRSKPVTDLSADEARLVDAARQFIASLPAPARALLENARKLRDAQLLTIAPDPKATAGEPLRLVRARVGPIPGPQNGLAAALCIAAFIAFFSVGPGVCVWLALSELMPTRIRSAGMGIALLINQGVATSIAAAFLPIVGNYGFYAMFLFWAGCTVIYFVTVAFFLPETKGKSLEEIEACFNTGRS